MDEISELIGLSLGLGFNELLREKQVCILVIEKYEKIKILYFKDNDENIRRSHYKATAYLRDIEKIMSGLIKQPLLMMAI